MESAFVNGSEGFQVGFESSAGPIRAALLRRNRLMQSRLADSTHFSPVGALPQSGSELSHLTVWTLKSMFPWLVNDRTAAGALAASALVRSAALFFVPCLARVMAPSHQQLERVSSSSC